MSKSLDNLPFAKTIGPNPDLPSDRLPTLQERHINEGRKRPERPAEKRLRSRKDHPDMERLTYNFGKPSPIFRAKRKKDQKVGDMIDPAAVRSMLVGALGTERQTSGGMPTLAERVQKEGVAAYGGKYAEHAASKAKPRKSPDAEK
jgi:hypothetical protein